MYRLDNFKFPSTELGLTALVQRPNDPTVRHWREGGYLKRAIPPIRGAIHTSMFFREHAARNTISILSEPTARKAAKVKMPTLVTGISTINPSLARRGVRADSP